MISFRGMVLSMMTGALTSVAGYPIMVNGHLSGKNLLVLILAILIVATLNQSKEESPLT